jgi:hypothetical protein
VIFQIKNKFIIWIVVAYWWFFIPRFLENVSVDYTFELVWTYSFIVYVSYNLCNYSFFIIDLLKWNLMGQKVLLYIHWLSLLSSWSYWSNCLYWVCNKLIALLRCRLRLVLGFMIDHSWLNIITRDQLNPILLLLRQINWGSFVQFIIISSLL